MVYAQYLLKAMQTCAIAGHAILEIYHSDFSVELKADSSPLTHADMRSHEIIAAGLKRCNIPILSEEGKDVPYERRKKWKMLWIVDPLDGTKEFISRNGEFTVNIALIHRGKPEAGVVFVPDKHLMYFAATGVGAYRLEALQQIDRLRYSGEKELPHGLEDVIEHARRLPFTRSTAAPLTIVGSRSHATAELHKFIEDRQDQFGEVHFVSAGSSLKFCLVAEGTADMYPRFGPTMEWDTAAGQAVAENAGARVLDFTTRTPLAYNKETLRNPPFIVIKSGVPEL